jgi:hypothetical protein
MKAMPAIGTKVMYRSEVAGKPRECVGEVVAQYYGHSYYDDDECETRTVPDHAGVRVCGTPGWWPYPDTNRFAPEIADLIEC